MPQTPAQPGRLGVGIIGAGKVGVVLGSALRSAGHAVVGVSKGSPQSQERAEVMLPGVPILEIEEVVRRAELVLVALPDTQIEPVVSGLAQLGHWQSGQLLVHPCGAYGTQILESAQKYGALPLAIHPAMTFTGTSLDLSRLEGCPFAVTAPTVLLPIAQALVVEMGGEPVIVAQSARPLYHAALSHGANHLVTLVEQALSALRLAGVGDPARFAQPLLFAALERSLSEGASALTGPVSRADVETVTRHLCALTDWKSDWPARTDATDAPDATKLLDCDMSKVASTYRFLATATAYRCQELGKLRNDQAQAIIEACKEN